MNSKGIFNLEYLIFFMILLSLFSIIMSISIQEFSSIEETQNRETSRIITSDISKIINEVYYSGEGYSKRYTLPSMINKQTYVLNINDTGVYINSHYQMTYSKIIPISNLSQKNIYLEPGNTYEFTNNNNSLEVNKVE